MKCDDALKRLAEAQRALSARILELADLEKRYQEALLFRENLGQGAYASSVDFHTAEAGLAGLRQHRQRCARSIASTKKELSKRMTEYLGARRRLKTLELLRERDFQIYKTERAKRENKILDEIYVQRAQIREGEQ